MNEDEIERLLSGAFEAQARREIGDGAVPPSPRFAIGSAPASGRRRIARFAGPFTAAAAVIGVVLLVLGVSSSSSSSDGGRKGVAGSRAATSTAGPGNAAPVHIKLLNSDHTRYGVGMPVIAYFSKKITDARPLQRVTGVLVGGKPARAAWYFERSKAHQGYPIEAHLRLRDYWPAHSSIHVDLPVRGVSAGTGFAYDESLTLDFTTGPRNVYTVDDAKHVMTVTSDGRTLATYPVSLGASKTPTQRGTKVIMEKGTPICLSGPGYKDCGVKYTQRLTYGGEYLHSAPWNLRDIDRGVNSSNGCTNLTPTGAKRLYSISEIGDVVSYPNATGSQMNIGQGYGDWNLTWDDWLTGGLVRTH